MPSRLRKEAAVMMPSAINPRNPTLISVGCQENRVPLYRNSGRLVARTATSACVALTKNMQGPATNHTAVAEKKGLPLPHSPGPRSRRPLRRGKPLRPPAPGGSGLPGPRRRDSRGHSGAEAGGGGPTSAECLEKRKWSCVVAGLWRERGALGGGGQSERRGPALAPKGLFGLRRPRIGMDSKLAGRGVLSQDSRLIKTPQDSSELLSWSQTVVVAGSPRAGPRRGRRTEAGAAPAAPSPERGGRKARALARGVSRLAAPAA